MAKCMSRLFRYAFQRKSYFPAWRYIYRLGLNGMGRIQGNPIEENGEEDVLQRLFQEYRPTWTILDVGANKGQYADAVLKARRGQNLSLHLFEPSAANVSGLRERYGTLASSNVQVRINAMALGEEDGVGTLFSDTPGSDIASLHDLKIPIRPFQEEARESVQVMTLDRYLMEQDITSVDWLKIDVEGGEYQVLKGAQQSIRDGMIRYIQFEFGAGNITSRVFFHDFWVMLSPYYHFSQVLKGGLVSIPLYSSEWEIFRTCNYLLTLKQEYKG